MKQILNDLLNEKCQTIMFEFEKLNEDEKFDFLVEAEMSKAQIGGVVAGAFVGGILGAVGIAIIIYNLNQRWKRKLAAYNEAVKDKNKGAIEALKADLIILKQKMAKKDAQLKAKINKMSPEQKAKFKIKYGERVKEMEERSSIK